MKIPWKKECGTGTADIWLEKARAGKTLHVQVWNLSSIPVSLTIFPGSFHDR